MHEVNDAEHADNAEAAARARARSSHDARDHVIALEPARFAAEVIARGRHPTHLGRLDAPDGYGVRSGWCGEVMEMYVSVDADRVVERRFWADGCLSTMACADMVATLVDGLRIRDAARIAPETVIEALGGLPHASEHCAALAVDTFRAAIEQMMRSEAI